jgi:3-dehydroquinate dehydratase-1
MMNQSTVTVRGVTLGEGLTKICIPVTAATFAELREQTGKILAVPFDLVEWRADFFEETEEEQWLEQALALLREQLGEKPILFTFRTKEEGGERSISLEEYEQLAIRAARSHLADLVDIELNRGEELLQRICRQVQAYGVKVIGSYHDFHATPSSDTFIGILTKMQDCGADITKAAVMPQKEQDVLEVLSATLAMKQQYADRPFITMAMGRLGAVSRLAGGLTGSALTFATAGRASAPGQLEAKALSVLLPNL